MDTARSNDPLVSLLYSLLRDHVQPGVMEGLVMEIEGGSLATVYTNGHLAEYAKDILTRLAKHEKEKNAG